MNLERIDNYWCDFFGIKRDEIRRTGVIVVPHHYLDGYNGAWIFKHKKKVIISVKPIMVKQIKDKIEPLKPEIENIFSKGYINYLFGNAVEEIIGPTYQGYFDDTEITIPISKKVVKISYEDQHELIDNLSRSGDQEGWLHSGVDKNNDGIYGYFHHDSIVSIGCYRIIRGDVGFAGVYTNPRFRGKGFSQEVVKKIVMELSEKGMLIRYQTLISNNPSIRIATKIGFKEYAQNIAIRLKKED